MTIINKYSGTCRKCNKPVSANTGWAHKSNGKWHVYHKNCLQVSVLTRFSSGAEIIQNINGRCEDAPCCGCCD